MAGGVNVFERPLTLSGQDVSGVVVTLTKQPTTLSGQVRRGSATGDPQANVAVFPADYRAWIDDGMSSRRFRSATVQPDGTFEFSGLGEGEYIVAAVGAEQPVDGRNVDDDRRSRPHRCPRHDPERRQSSAARHRREDSLRRDHARTRVGGSGASRSSPPRGSLRRSTIIGQRAVGPPPPPPSAPATRDGQAVPETGTSVISGIVVSDEAGMQPVRRAAVSARNSDSGAALMLMTDDAGRFEFRDLPAGRFVVSVTKPGYVATTYGAQRPQTPGLTIALTDGQRVTGSQDSDAARRGDHRTRRGRAGTAGVKSANRRERTRDRERRAVVPRLRLIRSNRRPWRVPALRAGRRVVHRAGVNQSRICARRWRAAPDNAGGGSVGAECRLDTPGRTGDGAAATAAPRSGTSVHGGLLSGND